LNNAGKYLRDSPQSRRKGGPKKGERYREEGGGEEERRVGVLARWRAGEGWVNAVRGE